MRERVGVGEVLSKDLVRIYSFMMILFWDSLCISPLSLVSTFS